MHQTIFFSLFFIGCLFTEEAFSREETLSERASNPITNLSQLQLENDYSPSNYGSNGSSNILSIKPVIALAKSDIFPFEQLIRFKCQVPTLPTSTVTTQGTSLGDTQCFDLWIQEQSWGRWGIGPMAILPTATKEDAGQGKWQLGPAFAVSVLQFPHLQFGFLAQNPISVAKHNRLKKPEQNTLLFQPFITYHFLRNTYLISNPEWTLDWKNNTQQIPINLGIGHTFSLGGPFKWDASFQWEWMAYQNAVKTAGFVPQSTLQFCLNMLIED